jgi:enamine deaminase RidA (YjgF/YER057c/UK114 family)
MPKAAPNAIKRHQPFPSPPAFASIYRHAVEVPAGHRTLHVSGQIGVTPDGHVREGFEAQLEQAIDNLEMVLAHAGMSKADIVRLGFFLTRASDLEALREARRRRLAVEPAVTVLVVSALAGADLLVEVEATAAAL